MEKIFEGCLTAIGTIVVGLVIGLMFSFLYSIVGVFLWSYAVVPIFGLPDITFWQMFALMVLARLFVPYRINYNKKED